MRTAATKARQLAVLGTLSTAITITGAVAIATPASAAVSSNVVSGGALTIRSNDVGTSVRVSHIGDSIRVEDLGADRRSDFPAHLIQRVVFIGGAGADTFGATGFDLPVVALGGGGNDILVGGQAADRLVGGPGNDALLGLEGDDTLVAIDGSTGDVIAGDAGRDAIWTDVVGANRDRVNGLAAEDASNAVATFANGADRSLDGDEIPDPATTNGWVYVANDGLLLFPNNGPRGSDIRQGSLSDCKTVAGISAVAHNTVSGNAWPVRARMADFGDGTYGVRLGDRYYRLDNDLPVKADGTLAYAKLGPNDSLWVALAEKAMAYNNSPAGAPDYRVLNSGGSQQVFQAFGSTQTGNPLIRDFASSSSDLGDKLFRKWNGYENVTITLTATNGTGLTSGHAYTLWSVTRNAAGTVTNIVFRNPWGRDGGVAGGYSDANPNDGIATVTPGQIYQDTGGRVNWGTRIS